MAFHQGTKFLTSRNKWTQISTYANSPLRLLITNLNIPHHLPLHPSLPPLLQPRLPHSPPSRTLMNSSHASSQPSQPSTKTVRLVIKGRVQGVFYRNWTIENATQLGLKGWVRNRRDGSVETLMSGDSDKVQEMEQRCRRGPPSAMVTALEVYPSSDVPGDGFERRQTV